MNAIEVEITYPPDKIQVANPSIGTSFVSVWVVPPTYSNTDGTLTFRGGIPSPGIITSNGVISTARFRARDTGEAELEFIATSKVLANDGVGTNILTSRSKAIFTIVIPPPEGPEVFSPTHPDQNQWYKNPDITFFWRQRENDDAYSYSLSQDPFEVPDEQSEGDRTSAAFSAVGDGIWYFNLRSLGGGTWGGTTHYIMRIDRTMPAGFTIHVSPDTEIFEAGVKSTLTFFTTDGASGIDHFEVRIVPRTTDGEGEDRAVTFFTEEASPYIFPVEKPGKYDVIVRAFDKAGNSRDSVSTLEIAGAAVERTTRDGFRVFGYLVRWWWLYLFLGLVLLVLLFLVWLVGQSHSAREEALREDLADTEERLLREYQEMYQKVRAYRKQQEGKDFELPAPPPSP